MPISGLSVDRFFSHSASGEFQIIDSRSEGEYNHAHIPGALNIPLLNNHERKIIGTLFKSSGREAAVLKGFELVGPNFYKLVERANSISKNKDVLLYCWRGGMRSNIMAWLLSTNGFNVGLLTGGYKAFRNKVLDLNSSQFEFTVVGGPTGSGKTEVLHQLAAVGEQVIDLEALAGHKGSAFGGIGKPAQPSSEQFENKIAVLLSNFNLKQRIWIENESRNIGSCLLPSGIYESIRNGILINIDVGYENRLNRITDEYGNIPFDILSATSKKLEKRLGPQHLKKALEHLQDDNFSGWLEIMLNYYDKLYAYGKSVRDQNKIYEVDLKSTNEAEFANKLIEFINAKESYLQKTIVS